MITKKSVDKLTYKIIGAAIEVQKHMGSGLNESVYHECMKVELQKLGLAFESEKVIQLSYKGTPLKVRFRCDLIVEEAVVVELKSVSELIGIHEAQMLNYMKLLKAPKGVLINFNSLNIFKNGQRTFVNEYYAALPND